MDNNLLISLDALIRGDEILVKNVKEHFVDKSCRDLLMYMVDSGADDINPGYGQNERRVAELINQWLQKASSQPGQYKFLLKAARKQGGDPIVLELERAVNTYGGDIIQEKPINMGETSVIKKAIDLFAQSDEVGGLYVPRRYITTK